MLVNQLPYGLMVFECLHSVVYAINFVPPPNQRQGVVVTVVPPATTPPVSGLLQVKVAADSHSCAKDVALGCPGLQLINNNGYSPTTNGCGPDRTGSFWDTFNSIINGTWTAACCDQHDLCFGSCQSTFDECNFNFRACLEQACARLGIQQNVCDATIPVYYGAVSSAFGCSVYTQDVGKSCQCPPTVGPPPGPGPYQEYFWILDRYSIQTLRSRNTDTNSILIGVDINDVPSSGGELSKFQGDQGAGSTSHPGLQINFFAQSTDRVVLWMMIYNGDTSPESIQKLQYESTSLSLPGIAQYIALVPNVILDSLGRLLGFRSFLKNILPQNIIDIIFANCDGWVLLEQITFASAAEMYNELTALGGENGSSNKLYRGYDSPDGCLANSRYLGTFRHGFIGSILPQGQYIQQATLQTSFAPFTPSIASPTDTNTESISSTLI